MGISTTKPTMQQLNMIEQVLVCTCCTATCMLLPD